MFFFSLLLFLSLAVHVIPQINSLQDQTTGNVYTREVKHFVQVTKKRNLSLLKQQFDKEAAPEFGSHNQGDKNFSVELHNFFPL